MGHDGECFGLGTELTNVPALSPGTYPIQVTATDDNGFVCTDITQLTILSDTDPNCICTVVASNSGPICEDGVFDLSATSVSNGSYVWEQSGNFPRKYSKHDWEPFRSPWFVVVCYYGY